MTDKKSDLVGAITAVEDEHDADLYLYSGAINAPNYGKLVKEVAKKRRTNALLILTTNGGHANAAYKIARLMQRSFERFTIFTPRNCYSAGTLVALGANCLLMDQFSELGPLDVQLFKKNEIGDQKSGLLSKSTFESLSEAGFDLFEHFMFHIISKSSGLISFNVASKVAADVTGQMMSPIFAQMNPDVVGSDYRDLRVAIEYGDRLVRTSKNAEPTTVLRLVTSYPSHDFIIDDEEAKKLFKNVLEPSEALYKLMGHLAPISYSQASPAVVMKLERPVQVQKDVETTEGADGKGRGSTAGAPQAGKAAQPLDGRRRRNRQSNRRGAN